LSYLIRTGVSGTAYPRTYDSRDGDECGQAVRPDGRQRERIRRGEGVAAPPQPCRHLVSQRQDSVASTQPDIPAVPTTKSVPACFNLTGRTLHLFILKD
jgi:hypothetical protein